MKKILISFLAIITSYCAFTCKQIINSIYNKIKYNDRTTLELLSLDSDMENEVSENISGNIVVSLNVDVESFDKQYLRKSSYDDYLEQANSYFTSQNTNIVNQLNITGFDSYYVSKYTPYIEYTYSYESFLEQKNSIESVINDNTHVTSAYISGYHPEEEGEIQESVADAMDANGLNAADIYENRTYTGATVNVGLIESGQVDATHSELSDNNVYLLRRDNYAPSISTHATTMARIITGEYGVAPDVNVYSADMMDTPCDEVDWMIFNQVDVVNLSFVRTINEGQYDDFSAYFDYAIANYDIMFVAATGNLGYSTAYVGNPALAYNAISVGSSTSNKHCEGYSSYEVIMGPYKPTLVAPGCVTMYDELLGIEGTSISCALVTGIIAVLYQKYPVLISNHTKLITLLTANAEKFDSYSFSLNNGFDNEIGAGELDYGSVDANYAMSFDFVNTTNTHNSFVATLQIALFQDMTLDVSLAWLVQSNKTANSLSYSDYDLKIYDDNNVLLASGASGYNNIETLRYTNTTEPIQVITIKVYQYGNAAISNEEFSISYRMFEVEEEE